MYTMRNTSGWVRMPKTGVVHTGNCFGIRYHLRMFILSRMLLDITGRLAIAAFVNRLLSVMVSSFPGRDEAGRVQKGLVNK